MELPKTYQECFSKEKIDHRVAELGLQITQWAKDVSRNGNGDLIVMPIMRGALFFAADLARAIDQSVEIIPIEAKAYSVSDNTEAQVEIGHIKLTPLLGRSLLLVDDICDSGRTLASVAEKLKGCGAKEIRHAVMIRRVIAQETFIPDYVGFGFVGDDWLVGYGMDNRDEHRNLPAIYSMKPQG